MREGSLEAPTRHTIDWQDPAFLDPDQIDAELRRVFDVCHGCRRCFNLCDSFPKLFDLIDDSPTGELDSVSSKDFKDVVGACTLCDMCFLTKCPYVPPHAFNIDFPHLMLRYRYAAYKKGEVSFSDKELAKTDRNGAFASTTAPLANWITQNPIARSFMEKLAHLDKRAHLPSFSKKTLLQQLSAHPTPINQEAPAFGQKAVLYATCFCNYNSPSIGLAAEFLLAKNGIETKVVYPACCGMPHLEQGNISKVVQNGAQIANTLLPWVEKGYAIIALIPSCALMIKHEWPLLAPENSIMKRVSDATHDISVYLTHIYKTYGFSEAFKPLDATGVTFHMACHARAQNMGQKAAELLKLIPNLQVDVVERCSGHGGLWGMKVDHFDIALKVGQPVVQKAIKSQHALISSECPLAAAHIQQGIALENSENVTPLALHPLEILAMAFGYGGKNS